MNLRFVALAEIDLDDGSFEIRKFGGQLRLSESLEQFGILDPAWLRQQDGRYIVVDGFKRLRWAKESGAQGLFCRIFPENCNDGELWTLRLEKKLFEPELDMVEKAQIISTLLSLFQPREIPGFFLCALNASNRPELLRKWVPLAAMTPETLKILASGTVAERAALELADWDQGSRNAALSMLQSLRCSAGIQVEIIEHVAEIAIRDGMARADVMESRRVREILVSAELNHRQKTQALRDLFVELRYPRLTARQKRFRLEVQSLGLPPAVKIIPPPAFEGGNWKMELSFTGPEELRKILDSAGFVSASKNLDPIFRPSPGQDKDKQG